MRDIKPTSRVGVNGAMMGIMLEYGVQRDERGDGSGF
jgi:hypothetical protein